jgi:uncharacterized protein (TIGR03790 family)
MTFHPLLRCAQVVAFGLLLVFPTRLWAGGGPENLFLVVNSRSWASVTIAHHFASLRQIPPNNILYLDWPYSTDQVDVSVFRDKLLVPIVEALKERQIGPQIDYVVYASDFPWSVDVKSLLGGQQLPPQAAPMGSLTSLTFFATMVARGDYRFLDMRANRYMRASTVDSRGFRGTRTFDVEGKVVPAGGESYLLSTMLGVTSGYGMTVSEVVSYLRRSASADGTRPKGTIYFCKTGDPHRSGVREPQFPAAVAALEKLGVHGEIISGKLPAGKDDVAGLVTGNRDFDWKSSKSTILPGAICENFTSFGAYFREPWQTRLTEFLCFGAAGSSGTVVEPYSIDQKFPSAFVQVHYARGCTLAESFYQSVAWPYQLLVVGDPLCRPWADIPTVTVDGATKGATLSDKVKLHAQGTAGGKPLGSFELYVEGVRAGRAGADGILELDTSRFPDGDVELRIVGIDSSPIESQGRLILPVRFDNHGRKIDFSCSAAETATWKQPFRLTASSPGAAKIVFFEGSRELGTVTGDKGEIEIKPEDLGTGPVRLAARAQFGDQSQDAVLARPIELTIQPSAQMAARALRQGTKLASNLQFKAAGGELLSVPRTDDYKWLVDTKVKPDETFTLAAIFDVPSDGMYQFELKFVGALSLKVDGQTLLADEQNVPNWHYVPAPLRGGYHQFELKGIGGQPSGMEIRFGGSGATHLDGAQFRHPVKSK